MDNVGTDAPKNILQAVYTVSACGEAGSSVRAEAGTKPEEYDGNIIFQRESPP